MRTKEQKEKRKQYEFENRIEIRKRRKEYKKKYDASNRKSINKKYNDRLKSDDLFKINRRIRNNIYSAFRLMGYTKKSKTQTILGIPFAEFKIYVETQFKPWMNWENQGKYNGELNYGWDLDHIIPISSATTEEEIIKLNHYTNFQPLCSYINRYIKRDKVDYE